MRDIPLFTTEYGAAGLVLREIPYQGAAYVHIHSSQDPLNLLKECVSFCRAVGAERIYAKGHDCLVDYPLHTTIWKMQCDKQILPQTDACLYPVTQETLPLWRRIYQEKIQNVPNAAWMNDADAREMLANGEAYFIHREGKLLGIGRVKGNELQWVASIVKGAGKDVVAALANCVLTDELWLSVSADNAKAIKLYESLGFIATEELSKWYKIF